CDSLGDLYPVTQPSLTPHALLSVSPSTWHQLLRNPREEVLRSLVSRDFISCNKEKSPHIFHACQLGKHVRLSFFSLNSVVTHSFKIVYSDIWTSPIHKYHTGSSMSRYKARLVANGCSQKSVIDCDETFSMVVKTATIRTVLSLILSRNWHIHQLDVKNAFLNSDLFETVYMYHPSGFVVSITCLSLTEVSIWIETSITHGSEVAYLLIYVDDIVLTTSSSDLLQCIISSLHKEFDMTDLGALNYFLGISVTRDSTSMFLSQKKYALELLYKAHMANCNPTQTLVNTESKLGSDGDPISDPTLYRSLVGDNLLSWSAKRQHTLSRSSAKAEYKGVAKTDMVIHTIETNIVRHVDEIESFGKSSDEFDKETRSSNGLLPKQADLSCVHA
nr:ribonuclease H-like domain-containing protein [Tanacetum cinerariifolium]